MSLECTICTVAYVLGATPDRRPRVLSCGHTLCSHCISQLIDIAQSELICPQCRQTTVLVVNKDVGSDNLPPLNFGLIEVIERNAIAVLATLSCHHPNCHDKATVFCVQCDEDQCDLHNTQTHEPIRFAKHTLINIAGKLAYKQQTSKRVALLQTAVRDAKVHLRQACRKTQEQAQDCATIKQDLDTCNTSIATQLEQLALLEKRVIDALSVKRTALGQDKLCVQGYLDVVAELSVDQTRHVAEQETLVALVDPLVVLRSEKESLDQMEQLSLRHKTLVQLHKEAKAKQTAAKKWNSFDVLTHLQPNRGTLDLAIPLVDVCKGWRSSHFRLCDQWWRCSLSQPHNGTKASLFLELATTNEEQKVNVAVQLTLFHPGLSEGKHVRYEGQMVLNAVQPSRGWTFFRNEGFNSLAEPSSQLITLRVCLELAHALH